MSTVVAEPIHGRSLIRTLSGLAPISLVVQMASFASSVALAVVLGATVETDAYYLALAVPTLASGVLMAAIRLGAIPSLTRLSVSADSREFRRAASELVTSVLVAAIAATILVTAVAMIVIPATVDEELGERTRLALLELSPYAVLGAATGALGAVLAVRGWFVFPVAVTVLEPLLKIPLTIFLGERLGMHALIAGNLAGSALGVTALWLILRRRGIRISLVRRFDTPFVRAVFLLSVPLVASQSVLQVNPLVDRWMASDLGAGSVTALELGLRLFLAPAGLLTGLLIAPLAATWAARRAAEGWPALQRSLTRAIEGAVLVVPPLVVTAVVLRDEATAVLFSGGAYSAAALTDTANVFALIALSLPAQLLIVAFSTLFVVQGDSIFPLKVAVANVTLNVLLNLVLRPFFGVAGIALATTLTLTLLLVVYMRAAVARWGRLLLSDSRLMAGRAFASVAVGGAAAWALDSALPASGSRQLLLGEVALVGAAIAVAHLLVLTMTHEPRISGLVARIGGGR